MTGDLVLIPNDFAANTSIFLRHELKLREALQEFEVTIEHVGSTSIPGTIGKGMIDIIITCLDEIAQIEIKNRLVVSGYRQGELNKKPDGRLFFCSVEGPTKAGDIHVHLVLKDSYNYREVIQFRDYFLTNPDKVELYNQEKLRLAKLTDNDRSQYVVLKENFIHEVLKS